ncbi:MAG: hypothetical protein HY532_02630 [Chloroflexi bacterium]|nr:hypothetical protein [Chloroflexota bacterium]
MPANSSALIGTAGVYYVAAQLAAQGFHAAVTHGNAPSVDILVGSRDGARAVSLQVKTSTDALRTKGRKPNQVPDHYSWRIPELSLSVNHSGLFYALVYLKLPDFVNKQSEKRTLPEVFVLPSKEMWDVHIANQIEQPKTSSWWWWHYPQELEQYKNNWALLSSRLADNVST